MLDNGIKVIRTVEDAKYKIDGTRESIIRVEYMVDNHGPFVERFPKDSYTAITRDQKLNDFAREVRTS